MNTINDNITSGYLKGYFYVCGDIAWALKKIVPNLN